MPFSWKLLSFRRARRTHNSSDPHLGPHGHSSPSQERSRPQQAVSSHLSSKPPPLPSHSTTAPISLPRPSNASSGLSGSTAIHDETTVVAKKDTSDSYLVGDASADLFDDPAFSRDPRAHLYFVANPDILSPTYERLASKPSVEHSNHHIPPPIVPTSTMPLFRKSKKPTPTSAPQAGLEGSDFVMPSYKLQQDKAAVSRAKTMQSGSKPSSRQTHKASQSHDVRPGLDQVDVMDGTDPVGLRRHHDGPYEAISRMVHPPKQPPAPTPAIQRRAPRFGVGDILPPDFAQQIAQPVVYRQPSQYRAPQPVRDAPPLALRPGPASPPNPPPPQRSVPSSYAPPLDHPKIRESAHHLTPQQQNHINRIQSPLPNPDDVYGGIEAEATYRVRQSHIQPAHTTPVAAHSNSSHPQIRQERYQDYSQPPPYALPSRAPTTVDEPQHSRYAQTPAPYLHQQRSREDPKMYIRQEPVVQSRVRPQSVGVSTMQPALQYQRNGPPPSHRPRELVMPAPLTSGMQEHYNAAPPSHMHSQPRHPPPRARESMPPTPKAPLFTQPQRQQLLSQPSKQEPLFYPPRASDPPTRSKTTSDRTRETTSAPSGKRKLTKKKAAM